MRFYKLTNDKMFKAVFSKKENWDLLEKLLYEVTDIKFRIKSLTIPEMPKNNIHKKGKILDIVAETKKGMIVNIELNNSEADYLHRRNASYIFSLYSETLKVSETYQTMPEFIQVNLTNKKVEIPLKSIYTIYDKEHNKEYIDNLKIYEINLQKAKEKWYNETSNKYLISLIDCDLDELNRTRGDDLVERLKGEVKRLNEDTKFLQFLSDEEEERLYVNSLKLQFKEQGLKEGVEEGLREGIDQGSKQRNIEIAKNMLEKNMDIKLISEITGLSAHNIENLK